MFALRFPAYWASQWLARCSRSRRDGRPSRSLRARRVCRSRQRGAVAIETALLLPIIFILLFAFMHFAMLFTVNSVMNYAAKEGVRQAFSVQACSPADETCDDTFAATKVKQATVKALESFTSDGAFLGVTLNESKIEVGEVTNIAGNNVCCQVTIKADATELPLGSVVSSLLTAFSDSESEPLKDITATASLALSQ